jgi:deoxyribonuclease-4
VGPPIGVHVSALGGASRAVARAAALGCATFQFFARNPRGWAASPLSEEEVEAFRRARAAAGIGPATIHTMYLINAASSDSALRDRSIEAIVEDLHRAERLGCEYVVTHLGSRGDLPPAEARARAVRALNRALRSAAGGRALLLLENAAGQGRILGGDFAELARIRSELREPERVGFAIDSAHLFAGGVDPRVSGRLEEALGPLAERAMLPALRLVHLNDSKTELGSRHDRHEHLGQGRLGRAGLRAFVVHPWIRGLPLILETPFEEEGADARNLRYAKRLVREALRATDPEAPPCGGSPPS